VPSVGKRAGPAPAKLGNSVYRKTARFAEASAYSRAAAFGILPEALPPRAACLPLPLLKKLVGGIDARQCWASSHRAQTAHLGSACRTREADMPSCPIIFGQEPDPHRQCCKKRLIRSDRLDYQELIERALRTAVPKPSNA
jgi:hypothetical protein